MVEVCLYEKMVHMCERTGPLALRWCSRCDTDLILEFVLMERTAAISSKKGDSSVITERDALMYEEMSEKRAEMGR